MSCIQIRNFRLFRCDTGKFPTEIIIGKLAEIDFIFFHPTFISFAEFIFFRFELLLLKPTCICRENSQFFRRLKHVKRGRRLSESIIRNLWLPFNRSQQSSLSFNCDTNWTLSSMGEKNRAAVWVESTDKRFRMLPNVCHQNFKWMVSVQFPHTISPGGCITCIYIQRRVCQRRKKVSLDAVETLCDGRKERNVCGAMEICWPWKFLLILRLKQKRTKATLTKLVVVFRSYGLRCKVRWVMVRS